MKLFSRVLASGLLAAGVLALASPAQAHDHWLLCPGTSTATACVAADPGDATFESSTVTYEDCVHLTSPDTCEVPVNQSAPIVSPVVEPPSAELYLQCGDSECVIPNPPPVNPPPVNPIALVDNLVIERVPAEIKIQS